MKEFWKFRSLLYELIMRDIKVKYRRSVLGLLWTILNPLLMMCVLYLVFSKLFRFDIENYAIYVLSGQVIFNFYQITTTDAMMAILNNSTLIKKVYIPKYMLVHVKILSGIVSLLASYLALLIVIVVTGGKLHMMYFFAIFPFLSIIMLQERQKASGLLESYRYMKKAESVQSGMKAAVLTSISKIKTGNMCFVAA